MATVAIALAGCSSSVPAPAPDTESPAASYVRTSPCGEGDSALLEGTVVLENGCLTDVDDAGQAVVPVFPTDFTWDDESGELSGFGHTLSAGDSVTFGGGYHDTAPAPAEHVPDGCRGNRYFLVHSG